MQYKIKDYDEISEIAERTRELKGKIATTNGSFDILHYAHVSLLEKAADEADILIVLLNSDDSIRRFKGKNRPIIPQNERALMLASIGCVDYVTIFDEDTPLKFLNKIRPDIHVKGGSFIPERIAEEQKLLSAWGGIFKNYELEEGYSSTNIINKILETYNSKNSA